MIRSFPALLIAFVLLEGSAALAQEMVPLPKPEIHGEFMKTLSNRNTAKEFTSKELSPQILSEVLWAAFGINDIRTERRTAASAFNVREMEIYVLTKDGGFRYDAPRQALERITGEDIRSILSTQEYAKNVPVHLVYVANHAVSRARYPAWGHPMIEEYSIFHTGLIAQNVYLYCAARGLGTVVRDVEKHGTLHEKLKLDDNRAIIMSQAVGYPGK